LQSLSELDCKEITPKVDNLCGFGNFVGMNRLTIEIDPEQHRQIKTLATYAGMTIKDYILAKTLNVSKARPEIDTSDKLLKSPKNAKRLRKAIASQTPPDLVFKSIEEVKHALGI
jgi:Antitoxin ParD